MDGRPPSIDASPLAAAAVLRVLHGAFRQQPGQYALALPDYPRAFPRLRIFADNRDALEKDIKAAVALGTLESIRDNPTPWSVVSQIEPLIATVDAINEALAQGKREHALLSIDAKIAEVSRRSTRPMPTPHCATAPCSSCRSSRPSLPG